MSIICRFVVVFSVVLMSANALTADTSLQGALAQCQLIAPDKDRLACYDAIAPKSATVLPAPIAPAVASRASDSVPKVPAAAAAAAEPMLDQAAEETSEFGMETVKGSEGSDVLKAKLIGDFSGWDGDTVFELDNGQVWVQVESSRVRYRGPNNPEVTIRRKAFGAYRLSVKGSNKTVRVRRRK